MASQQFGSVVRPYASNPAAAEWIFATCKRHQSTFRRTRKALKVKPDPSFAPTKTEARDHIIFNPPSSIPNVYQTPSKFLPAKDPRRHIFESTKSLSTASRSSTGQTKDQLPDALGDTAPTKYNVTPEQVEEIRKLRAEDPIHWTRPRLAEKFECSSFFIGLCAKSPTAGARHAAELAAIKARWGKGKIEAKEERAARKKLWGRD